MQRRQFVLNSGICGQRMRMSGQPDMPAIIGINGRTHDPNRSTSRQNLERPKSGKSRRPCSWSVFSDSISGRQAACRSSGGLEGHRPGGGRGHPKQFLEIHWLALGLHFGGAVFRALHERVRRRRPAPARGRKLATLRPGSDDRRLVVGEDARHRRQVADVRLTTRNSAMMAARLVVIE